MEQFRSLEQLLVIRENEIERLKTQLEHIKMMGQLQIEINEAQRKFNGAVCQELEILYAVVKTALDTLADKKFLPPPKNLGVSEVA